MANDRFRQFNPHPDGIRVGDCTVRAISKATGKPWNEVYLGLCVRGFYLHDMPSANRVWGAYLKEKGFRRRPINEDMTVADFCRDHPNGTFLLCSDGHIVCAEDGCYYDTWDSGQEMPLYYWERGENP